MCCLFVSALGTSSFVSELLNRPLILQMSSVETLFVRGVVSRKAQLCICSCDTAKTKIQIGAKHTINRQF